MSVTMSTCTTASGTSPEVSEQAAGSLNVSRQQLQVKVTAAGKWTVTLDNDGSAMEAMAYHWWELPYHLCCDKHTFVPTNTRLSRQTHVCPDKTLLWSWPKYACGNKTFVTTKLCLSHQNICRARSFVATKDVFCHDKHMFVATNTCLLQQKWHLWQFPPMIMTVL